MTSIAEPSKDHNLKIVGIDGSCSLWMLFSESESLMTFSVHGLYFNNINLNPEWLLKTNHGNVLLKDFIGTECKGQDKVIDVRVLPDKVSTLFGI